MYQTCENGIHVCRADEVANRFITVRNISCNREKVAKLFDDLKNEYQELNPEAQDLVVDMVIDGGTEDDFFISTQMLNRLEDSARDEFN